MDEFEQSGLSRKAFCVLIRTTLFSAAVSCSRKPRVPALLAAESGSTAAMQVRVGDAQLVLPMSVSPRWVAGLVKALEDVRRAAGDLSV